MTQRGRSCGCETWISMSASPTAASDRNAPISSLPAARFSRRFATLFPAQRTRIADRGLREGMLLELMEADGALTRRV